MCGGNFTARKQRIPGAPPRPGGLGRGHHIPPYPAQLAHSGHLVRAVPDRRQHRRARRARFSRLWFARPHAKLGRTDRAGNGEFDEEVVGVLASRRPVPDSPSHRLHRRSGSRGLRSQGVFETAMSTPQIPLLEVRNLKTYFHTEAGTAKAVDAVDFTIFQDEVVGLVGESGSGKTVTALSILRLIPDPPGKIVEGSILFQGQDLLKISWDQIRAIRGKEISMIFQEPMTSLNPVFTIGMQLIQALLARSEERR